MASKISQVNACGPLLATAPSVSTPTSVQIRRNTPLSEAKARLSERR
jgi:hypothetical protein